MISRGQMYRQMYNIGGEGIMSLDAGAPSIKYEGDIKPKQEVADVNLPLDVQGWFQSLPLEQQIQLLNSDIDEAYKNELRKLMGKNTDSGIMNAMPRDMAKFGGLKKIFKKATNVVKDVVKSDIGKAALLGAAAFGVPGTQFGGLFGRAGLGGQATGLFGSKGIGATLFGTPASTVFNPNASFSSSTPGFFQKALNTLKGGSLSKLIPETAMGRAGAVAAIGGLTGFLAGQGKSTEEIETIMDRPESLKPYLKQYYLNLNPDLKDTMEGEAAAEAFAQSQMGEYGYQNKAYGGRIGYSSGTGKREIILDMLKRGADADTIKEITGASDMEIEEAITFFKYGQAGVPIPTFDQSGKMIDDGLYKGRETRPENKAYGGRMMKALGDTAQMASGIEGLPLRQNPMGTNEIDLRDTGGFIPPVGVKEKADDIPAMLSNNEFVFTADAVRGMGNGDVNVGAQRMYDMMKKLENGGRV